MIYEIPRTANGLNAGDLLAAGTAWDEGNFTAQKIEVFKSTDHGASWRYLSNRTETSGQPNTIGQGIWEPWFLLAPNNTLACFISDERPAGSPTNNQIIGHYTSTNGGASWSGKQWRAQANGSLLNPQSGRCLDSPGGATADGTDLQIYDCNGQDPQRWKVPA